MSAFHQVPEPYQASRDGDLVTFSNRYTSWTHDLSRGGELTAAVVRHGSGCNLLAAPQRVSVATMEERGYHPFSSLNSPAAEVRLEQTPEGPQLSWSGALVDDNGTSLPAVTLRHSVCYRPWGYARHRVTLHVPEPVHRLGQIQIGSLFVAAQVDTLAVAENMITSGSAIPGASVRRWLPLHGGRSRSDVPAYLSRWLANAITLFRRGREGIEIALGDELGQWDGIGTRFPGWQQTLVCYNAAQRGYEVRLCPLDSFRDGQVLQGDFTFTFTVALPYVKPQIVPIRPGSGGIFKFADGFAGRWPTATDIARWQEAGVTLMRLHNDGNSFNNGIFWRDGAYPPYPPDEMAKMADFLEAANRAGIAVAPYFSVKEFHPEADGYGANATAWCRLTAPDEELIMNRCRNGVFGAQMCLESGWLEKRRETIRQVLRNHPFRGVYYDWCLGSECLNPAHCNGGRHWDRDRLVELLEWSHESVGPDGEVYLHLTNSPCLAAENLASLVLTEESGYGEISPLMFTPHVHFMNIAPRQICDMLGAGCSDEDRRRLALCAILHHAGISSVHPVYLDFYRQPWLAQVTAYSRHTAPGEGITATGDDGVGMSLYWKENRAFAVFANCRTRAVTTSWQLNLEAMEVAPAAAGTSAGTVTLEPLQLKTLALTL